MIVENGCKALISFFQIRLDFDTFVITGPSTKTITSTLLYYEVEPENYVQYSQCSTDIFGISNAPTVPPLCGTLTGDHGKNTQ